MSLPEIHCVVPHVDKSTSDALVVSGKAAEINHFHGIL
ncbi:hypothetical protein A11S_142 [Micavibrio aeruginosavorus EPB]|uniref:Uncharacterized protein n=1 Tax=Micavibrio aeruginosavorus EPB TaxID=349215 RepID=M4VUX8_9BACT|nr:hypothetical protein A11S_142 [Micavibrio aeruginosavorus EPB]